MGIEIKIFEGEAVKQAVELCLKHKLYVFGRMAKPMFIDYAADPNDVEEFKMLMLFKDDVPLAWVIKFKGDEGWCGTPTVWRFTHRKHRHQSFNRQLMVAL